jgi:hypothetical protein
MAFPFDYKVSNTAKRIPHLLENLASCLCPSFVDRLSICKPRTASY